MLLVQFFLISWTLYCKCTNFQANHNRQTTHICRSLVGLYIANVLTFKRITTVLMLQMYGMRWTLYCKCTNFQANHNGCSVFQARRKVGLYIANVLTFKRITTNEKDETHRCRWTLYCKCTNFQANHNNIRNWGHRLDVGLYIANVLTFKRITTEGDIRRHCAALDSILQMY